MKSFISLVLVGLVAFAAAGQLGYYGYSAFPATAAYHAAVPYTLTQHSYNTFVPNYQLKLDTSLPGSAYAAYPYAAAPTAYGYGVVKTL